MDTHKNASLTPKGREVMVRAVVAGDAVIRKRRPGTQHERKHKRAPKPCRSRPCGPSRPRHPRHHQCREPEVRITSAASPNADFGFKAALES